MAPGGTYRTNIVRNSGLVPAGTGRAFSGPAHRQWDRRADPAVSNQPSSRRERTHKLTYRAHLRDRRGSRMARYPDTPPVGGSFLRSRLVHPRTSENPAYRVRGYTFSAAREHEEREGRAEDGGRMPMLPFSPEVLRERTPGESRSFGARRSARGSSANWACTLPSA